MSGFSLTVSFSIFSWNTLFSLRNSENLTIFILHIMYRLSKHDTRTYILYFAFSKTNKLFTPWMKFMILRNLFLRSYSNSILHGEGAVISSSPPLKFQPCGCSVYLVAHLCLISAVYSCPSEIIGRCFQGVPCRAISFPSKEPAVLNQ